MRRTPRLFAHSHTLTLAYSLTLAGCTLSPPETPATTTYVIEELNSGSTAGLRGVSVVDASVAWASGARGTVLRTVDGGATWTPHAIPHADTLDFRDIEAFDSLTAYVLSAGEDGRIYKTINGGRTWALLFRNRTRGAFFDCFAFWDVNRGIAMSDPVAGRFLLLRTDDGLSWRPIVRPPVAEDGEAAFAASGTCLVATGKGRAYMATGGAAEARVFVSNDRGATWRATSTPVTAGASSAGIFSLAFRDENTGLALGGDYQKPEAESAVAMTTDGGRQWVAVGRTSYVSGAAFSGRSNTVVAVGTKGTRVSTNGGITWQAIDTLEYNAVQLAADGTGYAVGPRGRIGKLENRSRKP